MKKIVMGNFAWLLTLGLLGAPLASVWAEKTPYFLILNETANLMQLSTNLSRAGYAIKRRVPERILVVESRDSQDPQGVSGVQSVYASAVPISMLEPFGPLAVAAGLQWNRSLIKRVQKTGVMSASAVHALISQNSLPAPKNLLVTDEGPFLSMRWDAVHGAPLYEVYIAKDDQFNDDVRRARTNGTRLDMAKPQGGAQVYVQIRTLDRERDDATYTDIRGAWSAAQAVSHTPLSQTQSLSPPSLFSPLNGYESEGFTLILEWSSHVGERTRIQIASEKTFNAPEMDIVVKEQDFVVPASFMRLGRKYYWRVQAWGAQTSAWSDVREFTVGAPRHIGGDMFVNPERPK